MAKKTTKVYYPWAKWTDGKWHSATPEVDFVCKPTTFVSNVYNYAQRSGYTATVKRGECPTCGGPLRGDVQINFKLTKNDA